MKLKALLISSLAVCSLIFTGCKEKESDKEISVSEEQIDSVTVEKEEKKEAPSNTWTGAESLEELKTKLNGTTWHSQPNKRYDGIMYKFVFDNGRIKRYSALAKDGKWSNDVVSFSSYKVEQKRDSGGENFIQVSFGDLESDLAHAPQQIAFIDKCKTVAWFINGNLAGMLTFGDYTWSDNL